MGSRTHRARYAAESQSRRRPTLKLEALEPRILLSGVPAYTLQTLASFNWINGSSPTAGLIMDGRGNLCGTTSQGGANGDGTVFEIKAGSNTITTLASFSGSNGAYPAAGLIMDGTGNLYGTTEYGGANNDGTVFEIAAGSDAITTLASFNGTNGDSPYGGVIMDGSVDLCGTTSGGGANGVGTVFEIAAGSNAISTLASFNPANDGGYGPRAGLLTDGSGDLCGTTEQGGTDGHGTVFEITAASMASGSPTITPLASFNGINGVYPYAGFTVDGSGNLYGTTELGGADGVGTVYEIEAGSSTITTLASFNGTDGWQPAAGLIMDGSGNLYGTAGGGGNNYGTVFEIAAGSNTITTLATFNGNNGASPLAGLVMDGSGNLYGTTQGGGANPDGTVFELSPATTPAPAELAFVQQPTGAQAGCTLALAVTVDVEDANGNVVTGDDSNLTLTLSSGTFGDGSTAETEPAVDGVATFSNLIISATGTYTLQATDSELPAVTAASSLFTVTAVPPAPGYTLKPLAFFNISNGTYPAGPLIMDGSGNLYGTTIEGGVDDDGTVFEITAASIASGSDTITTLATFNGGNGASPEAGLIMDGSGNIYGTTEDGGANGFGTVFEVKAGSGTITTLAPFNASNGMGAGADIVDSSGNLYGTIAAGGFNNNGTVFEIEAGSNTITTIASFNGTNGSVPNGVIMDGSGNLYGITSFGGAGWDGNFGSGDGTVFKIDADSNLITTLVSFDNLDTRWGGVIVDGGGNLYGTCGGGASGDGAVCEIAAGSNTVTTLASFNKTNGEDPDGGVLMESSGNLYGTTVAGGADNYGTVFELAAGGKTITTLASFDGTDGVSPNSGLIMDGSGDLYGTTDEGGADNYGTVFELSPAPTPKMAFVQPPTNAQAGSAVARAVIVDSEDANGDVLTTDNSDVTLTLSSGTFGDGNTSETVSAVNGVATFSDLVIDTAGTYTLAASDSADGLSGFGSNSFTITPAAASQLVFTAQPQDTTAGETLTPVQVAVEDQYGNAEGGDSSSTISLTDDTGTLAGTIPETVTAGVATFADLTIARTGVDHLYAADSVDELSGFKSNGFTVAGAAAQLAFIQQPTNTAAGIALSPAVTVQVEDGNGYVVTDDNANVTVTLSSGTFGDGNTSETVAALSGVATFSSLVIDAAGPYTLTASDSADSLSGLASNSFTISPAAASQLVFTAAPVNGVAGATLSPAMVAVEDPYGNVESADTSSVTVAIGPGSTGSGTLTGTKTEPVVNGVATFSNLSISATGTYTLQATDGELPTAATTAPSFTVASGSATTALPAADAFPFIDGVEWDYKMTQSGHTGSITAVSDMTSPDPNDATVVQSSPDADAIGATSYFESDPSGVYLTEQDASGASVTFDDLKYLPNVLTPGKTFSSNGGVEIDIGEDSLYGTCKCSGKVVGWTAVSVPDGNYLAMEVDLSLSYAGSGTINDAAARFSSSETDAFYYVPGLGYVKELQRMSVAFSAAGYASEDVSLTSTYVLTSDLNILPPTPADLTAQFGSITLPTPSVPGDKGNVTVIVANQGETAADGSMTIDLYASPDQNIADGVLLSGGVLANEPVSLGDGQSQVYTFHNVQLPQLPAGSYYMLAVGNVTQPVSGGNETTSTAAAAEQMGYEFGTVGTRKNVKLSLTEPDGTVASFLLSGAGTGDVTVSGDEWDLTVTGTAAKSSVTITTKAPTKSASGLLSLDDITVSGPLGTFSGTGVNLGGSLNVSGALGMLSLANSGGKSPVGGNVLAGASLNAGSVGTVRVGGSFEGTSAAGITLNAAAVGSLSVTGAMDYTQLLSTGDIGSVSLGSMADSDVFAGVATDVTGLPSAADFSSETDSIKSFTITGGSTAAESFINSNIAAWTLGTVSLGYPDGSNGGIPFGVACNKYTTLSCRNTSGKLTTWKYPKSGTFAVADGVVRLITS